MPETISAKTKEYLNQKYNLEEGQIPLHKTRKDFEGDLTIVTFPYLKKTKKNPIELGKELGEHLLESVENIMSYNVVKGFLNLKLSDKFYIKFLQSIEEIENYGVTEPSEEDTPLMIEFSSPNTNKPLHIGHLRNNLLGSSMANILEANGNKVVRTQIINDRGIHICKSMIAWQKFGNEETPFSTEIKGDHFVGKYYVLFDKIYKHQIADLISEGKTEKEAKEIAPILLEARELLKDWEAGKPEVMELWKTMNSWVYSGFSKTYGRIGVTFDHIQYESKTYLLGKEEVLKGLEKGIFFKKEDGSVWVDLSDDGLAEKLLLRSDGTSVYMTQDIGTAIERFRDFNLGKLIYTVGDEQDYHFEVLFKILGKLGYNWSRSLHHLSYGMVDLPHGKMKSREGTVVDADDLLEELKNKAEEKSKALGKAKLNNSSEEEQLYEMIGQGAMKYFLLKIDPRKRVLFNPEESIDFEGNTGPFIQYTYARIQSILRKGKADKFLPTKIKLTPIEREVIKTIKEFPEVISLASENLSPSIIANYSYDLVKNYNSFYQSIPILSADDESHKNFRLLLSEITAKTIKTAMGLLGIQMPSRM